MCTRKHARLSREDWLFDAASNGCLQCVQEILSTGGVHPFAMKYGYTILDASIWAECQEVEGAKEVVKYLRDTYRDMPSGHRPSKGKEHLLKNWLFRAASDGCLDCVKHFLEKEELRPFSLSEPLEYTVLDMAIWAKCKGVKGAQEVAQYLRDAYPQMPSGHRPSKRHQHLKQYWLFQAACDGCLECVRHFLTKEDVDPFSVSETQKYTVLDMANWAEYKGVKGAPQVLEYLRKTYPTMPSRDDRRVEENTNGDGGIAMAPRSAAQRDPRVIHPSQLRRWDSDFECWDYPAEEYARWEEARAAGDRRTAYEWFYALQWRYSLQQERTTWGLTQQ